MKSLYELLGANAGDDAEALEKAFRKAVKTHHPDVRMPRRGSGRLPPMPPSAMRSSALKHGLVTTFCCSASVRVS